jgi:hypothetical protein
VNGVPTVALAVKELVITGASTAAATVITREAVPVPPALVAPMVTVVTAATVGVPVIAPVAVSTAKPAGRFVAEYDVGVREAAIW